MAIYIPFQRISDCQNTRSKSGNFPKVCTLYRFARLIRSDFPSNWSNTLTQMTTRRKYFASNNFWSDREMDVGCDCLIINFSTNSVQQVEWLNSVQFTDSFTENIFTHFIVVVLNTKLTSRCKQTQHRVRKIPEHLTFPIRWKKDS